MCIILLARKYQTIKLQTAEVSFHISKGGSYALLHSIYKKVCTVIAFNAGVTKLWTCSPYCHNLHCLNNRHLNFF